jgi:hypothetical protein
MDFIKYDMTDLWASAGDVVAPDPTKVRAGWGVEVVPRQWWNWFENRQDNNLAYMLQKGIPEWDATTQYIINKSYVQRNGIVYKATATSTNSDPVALTSWIKAFSDSTPFLEAMKGLGVTNSSVPVFNSTGIAAFLSYGSTGAGVLATTTPAAARTVIDAQQSSSNLTALASVAANTNKLPYFNGTTTATVTDLTDFGRSLIDDVDAATARTTLGVDSAVSVTAALGAGLATKQPLSVALTALATTTPATNTLPYYTGSTTATTTPITDFGRTLLSNADATASRASLGVDSSTTSAANLATRQPLNANLTSMASLAGLADTLPYFTGAASLALTSLTTKARSLLSKVDTASMQTELGLVPAVSRTDATVSRLALVGQGGFGSATPIVMLSTDDADTLPAINGRFSFTNGGLHLPDTYVFIDQITSGSGTYTRQIAQSINSTGMWVRFFVAGSANGAAWVKQTSASDFAARDSVTAGQVLTVGHAGWNGGYAIVIGNGADCNTLTSSNLYALNGSFTNGPPNFGTAAFYLRVSTHGVGYYHQVAYGITHGGHCERRMIAGVWQPWINVYNEVNATFDTASGGLMSAALVGGYNVTKYANGEIQIVGRAPLTAVLGANTLTQILVSLPVAIVNGTLGYAFHAQINLEPNVVYDCYSPASVFLNNPTQFGFVVRNGATAQAFTPLINVRGRWK